MVKSMSVPVKVGVMLAMFLDSVVTLECHHSDGDDDRGFYLMIECGQHISGGTWHGSYL